jgi:carboxypeptidase family protein
VRFAVLLAAAPLLYGQSVLTGRVVDVNETPVSQARITVVAGGVRQATSDPTGQFSIALPGPGDYLVNVQREGFYELRDHPVQAGALNEVTLVLTPIREVFQSVNVNETPSPVDTAQTTRDRRLTGTEVNDVPYPASHSLRNSMRLIPGVVQDQGGALHFEGAQENQVLYTLNGFNIGDPLTGRFDTRLAVEGIRSLEFSSGRYSPEFGKGSAGILAIHTDTGTDEFHYTATNFIPGIDTHDGVQLGNWTPRFGFSGPIRRGRAWFADNFDVQFDQGFVSDLPAGQNRHTGWGGSNLLHTQLNLTPSNILFVDFLANVNIQNRFGLGVLDPVWTTTTQRAREFFGGVRDQLYFGHGFLVELGYAHNYFFTRQIPQGHALYIQAPSGRGGNYFIDSTQQTSRDQLLANAFLPAFHFAGTHQIKIGSDLDRLGYSADIRRTGFEQIGLDGEVLALTTFSGRGAFERPSAEASSYAVDSWRLRKDLQVDLGLRQDWDELVRQLVLSPRASLAYAPFASENTRISAGYAITYDAANPGLFSQPLDQQAVTTHYNPDGTQADPPAVTAFVIDNPHLKTPRSINWSGSVDRRLPHHIDASVNYLWRHTRDGLTYASGTDGLFHLTNLRRDAYHSASVVVRQNLAGGYEWMASYTHSSATSNAVLNLTVDQTMQVLNNFGSMPWDVPNRFLATAYLPAPRFKEWAVAVLADARSGFPFSVVDPTGTVVGVVDSHRYPANIDLNVHLERRFTFRGYRFALRGGFNNILDHLNPTAVNNTLGSPQFLQFFGHEGRHFVLRIRFFGRA